MRSVARCRETNLANAGSCCATTAPPAAPMAAAPSPVGSSCSCASCCCACSRVSCSNRPRHGRTCRGRPCCSCCCSCCSCSRLLQPPSLCCSVIHRVPLQAIPAIQLQPNTLFVLFQNPAGNLQRSQQTAADPVTGARMHFTKQNTALRPPRFQNLIAPATNNGPCRIL